MNEVRPKATSQDQSVAAPADRGRMVRSAAWEAVVVASLLTLFAATLSFRLGAAWIGIAAAPLFGFLAHARYRGRKSEIERGHAREAQLSIYRVGETFARVEREEDLFRQALEAIAQGTGIPHWAIYVHRGGRGEFGLAATRGLPEGAEVELRPDPVASEAASPASRAAWQGETQVVGDPSLLPSWEFPTRATGLGPSPVVVSIPVADLDDAPAVLQCFLPKGTELGSERSTLLRWIAAQLSAGLKRLRLERRDQILASFMMSTGEILLGLNLAGEITHANAAAERALGSPPGALIGSR
ncbi:MAG: hypothetical protein ACRENN_01715, partial [Candidatus Eiseniibacteriota bacterium]